MDHGRKFAVFDIDGTIGRNSLFLQTVDELIAAGHLPPAARVELDKKLESYRRRQHPDAFREFQDVFVKILFTNLTKLKVSDYHAAVDAVVSRSKEYTYVFTRDLIHQLKAKDYFLIAISGSETYAVQQFTRQYGFDIVVGEKYHEKDGRFTGQIDYVFNNKKLLLREIIEQHKLAYPDSIAVGDSAGDIPLLEQVETPIAFNPEQQLFAWAKQHGTKIVIERKNVIYELRRDGRHYVLDA